MKKQIITLAIALAVLSTGISTVLARDIDIEEKCSPRIESPKCTPEARQIKMQKMAEKFEAELGLTSEQSAKAKEIRKNTHEKIKPLIEKKKAKIKEIKEIRDNDDIKIVDQDKKIEKIRGELKTIDQQIRQVEQDMRNAFKAILTEEQQEKINQLRKKAMKHHKMYKKNRCR